MSCATSRKVPPGASDGSKQLEGKISHLVLSSTRPASWKLDRLAKADVWDEPFIEGLEPTVPSIRRAVEPSWRDVVANLEVTAPTDDACYFATMIAQPDELTLDYRVVARTGSDSFEGERITSFAPYGLLGAAIARTADPAVVALTSPNDIDQVIIGRQLQCVYTCIAQGQPQIGFPLRSNPGKSFPKA